MNYCGQKPPAHWIGASLCVREEGHGPKMYDRGLTPVLKKKRKPGMVEGTAHQTKDGRVWPAGGQNWEYA